jgi:hypothetical protein
MVYIIWGIHPIIDHNHVFHHFDQVSSSQSPMEKRHIKVEALVKLIAAYLAQIIAPAGEKQGGKKVSGIIQGGRITRTQLLVKLKEGLVNILGRVALNGRFYVGVFWHAVVRAEELDEFLIAAFIDVIATTAPMTKAAFIYPDPGILGALAQAIMGADVPTTFRA